ncbi:Peptidyl-prolyl cis-trans isomerase fkbp8 [Globisporangium polare]
MVAIPESERADFDDLLGSGGIFRKMLRTNPDGALVEFGEEVTIRYSEKLLETDALISSDQTRKFRIGDGEAMPALELVAKMLRVGEACEVRCDARFAYGDVGLEPKVPAGAPMKLQIELLRVGKKITAEMTSAELIEEAHKKKESGNRYFQEKNYEQAAKLYKRALKLLETWEHSEDDAQKCKDLLIALGNNVGNVQFRLKQYTEARQSSLEVLQLDPRNVKAMYRMGQIGLEQNDFAESMELLQKAAVIEPKNVKVRQLMKDLKKKKQQVKQEQKKLYAKLGGAKSAADGDAEGSVQQQRNILMRAWKWNPSLSSALLSGLIAILMYQFIGKRFHGMD